MPAPVPTAPTAPCYQDGVGRLAGRQVGRSAGWQVGRLAGWQVHVPQVVTPHWPAPAARFQDTLGSPSTPGSPGPRLSGLPEHPAHVPHATGEHSGARPKNASRLSKRQRRMGGSVGAQVLPSAWEQYADLILTCAPQCPRSKARNGRQLCQSCLPHGFISYYGNAVCEWKKAPLGCCCVSSRLATVGRILAVPSFYYGIHAEMYLHR